MSAAGDVFIIDAEIARIKLRIKSAPGDKALQEKVRVLINAREKLPYGYSAQETREHRERKLPSFG